MFQIIGRTAAQRVRNDPDTVRLARPVYADRAGTLIAITMVSQ